MKRTHLCEFISCLIRYSKLNYNLVILSEMERSKMEDPQTKEEDDAIDKAKEVDEELKNREDTNEEGKSIPL